MNLTLEKRQYIGLQYVLDMLNTVSPYGARRLSRLKNYGLARQEQLMVELNNMKCICLNYTALRSQIAHLTHCLSTLKYITNSLTRLEVAVLSDVELFEIKSFLLTCEQIEPVYNVLCAYDGITLVALCDYKTPLSIIDDGQRRAYFAVPDDYSAKLAQVRKEKLQLTRTFAQQRDETLLCRFNQLCAEEKEEESRYKEQLCRQLAPYAESLKKLTEIFANLDLLLAKCALAKKTKAVCPTIDDKLSAVNMTNPRIVARLENDEQRCKKFAPLSIDVPCGSTVITGANMGGKSVALQTLTLNVALANRGFFVYAKSFDTPIFDYIDYISGECENTLADLSSFGTEVTRLNACYAETKHKRCFLAFDEFAKTTNASEGARLFTACVTTFNNTGAYAVFTTHFDGVAKHAQSHYRVKGLKPTTQSIDYAKSIADSIDYGLAKVGAEERVPRDAIVICRLLGLSQEILDNLPAEEET